MRPAHPRQRCAGRRAPTARQRRRRSISCLNNRYHEPTTGQFISVDPLVTVTGEPYICGAANPITYSDPEGLCADPGCWDFLGVVVRELTGQDDPGSTSKRQREYNGQVAAAMDTRVRLLGADSWSAADPLYYQQLNFGPTYQMPDAGFPFDVSGWGSALGRPLRHLSLAFWRLRRCVC